MKCHFTINNGYPSMVLDMNDNPQWCMLCKLKYHCKVTPLKKLDVKSECQK